MSELFYYPEMDEKKPIAQIEARLAYYGKHYYLDTPLQLKGRGVSFLNTYRSEELTPMGQRKVGWNQYKVTQSAYDKIKNMYSISYELLLD